MQTSWIVNKKYDLFFFIGSVAFSWLFLFLYNLNPFPTPISGTDYTMTAVVLYLTFTTFFDHPHIFQMVSRIYYDKVEFGRRKVVYTWGLFGFVLLGWAILFFKLDTLWSDIYSTVGAWHIIGQNIGFFKIYRAKAGHKKDLQFRLEVGAFTLLSWIAVFQYFRPTEFGQNQVWNMLILPQVFFDIIKALAYFIIAFLLYVMLMEVRQKKFSAPKWIFTFVILLTDFVMFSQTHVPLLVLVVLETAYHDIQYHGWTGHYQRHRFGPKLARNFFALAICYGLVVGFLEFMSESGAEIFSYLFMPFTMFVFFHYCLDGKIWKVSSSPELSQLLKQPSSK